MSSSSGLASPRPVRGHAGAAERTPGFRVRAVSGPDQGRFEAGRGSLSTPALGGVALTDGDASRNHAAALHGYRTTPRIWAARMALSTDGGSALGDQAGRGSR